MSVPKHRRAIKQILTDLGVFDYLIELTGRSFKVRIRGPLGEKMIVAAATPSDHRALMNIKMDIRRAAKEVGAVPA